MQFHLTDAGLAAFVNPANTGLNALVIDRIGVSAVALPGAPEDHHGLLALPNELKRIATFGGANVGDNIIHVTIRDESADTYSLRTFGLYAATGVLLAYVTSTDVITEKTPSSMTLLAADLAFVAAIVAEVVFGDTDFLLPPATTVTAGLVELATKEESFDGLDQTRAVTPFGLKWVLSQILGGFALTGHVHDAAAITSGFFDAARIPVLAMGKINGLVDALANKSSNGHTHGAGDVTSGTFDVGRIPALAMEKITGLAVALAGKSSTGHGHAAADVTSGTFDAARIPDLEIAKIIDLVPVLNGKANAAHTHAAGDVTSGTFDVGRIPALAMEKITGLAVALANKVSTADFTWGNLGGRPDVAIKDTDTLFNSVQIRQASSPKIGRIYFGDQSDGARQMLYNSVEYQLPGAPLSVLGSRVWTAATFDPATKAALAHTHTTADITDLLDKFWPAGELRLYAKNALPSGGARVLIANGAAVSRTTYARLFNEIGTAFGAGDGVTTFNLPDFRGVFFRGLDQGRGLDTGRAIGVLQMSQNLSHAHTYTQIIGVDNTQAGSGVQGGAAGTAELTTSSGGSEARPTNQALLACVTY